MKGAIEDVGKGSMFYNAWPDQLDLARLDLAAREAIFSVVARWTEAR